MNVGTIMGDRSGSESQFSPASGLHRGHSGRSVCPQSSLHSLSHSATPPHTFSRQGLNYGSSQHRTQHVAQASLKLFSNPPAPHQYSTPHLTHTSETCAWEQVACDYLWSLSHSLHQDRIQPHSPTSLSKNHTSL